MSYDRSSQLPSLGELIGAMSSIGEDMEALLERGVDLGLEKFNSEDHLVIACLRRGLDNIQGLIAMADQRNMFCGVPIVRFQIDTAMTLFGRHLVADVDEYVGHMLKGKKRSDFKDRDGEKMTDSHLHRSLDRQYQYTSNLYSEASGFVHFSTHHLNRVLDLKHRQESGTWRLLSADAIVAGWPDDEVKDALLQCAYASDVIVDECKIWERTRFPN